MYLGHKRMEEVGSLRFVGPRGVPSAVGLYVHECFMLASQFRFVSTSGVSLLPSLVPRRAIKGRVYCFSYCEFKVCPIRRDFIAPKLCYKVML